MPRSICLGFEQYSSSLAKIRTDLVHSTRNINDAKDPHTFHLKDVMLGLKKANSEDEDDGTWYLKFFKEDVYILGFGLDLSEQDIWWLLDYRIRQKKGSMLSNIFPDGGVVISQVGFGVTALISFLITIISHRIDHRRYYENWVRYRSSAEDIIKECILFINKCGEDYSSGNQEEIEKAFICNIEKIADKETDSWKSLVADSDNQSHNGQARTPDVGTERIDDSDESKIIKKNESLTK